MSVFVRLDYGPGERMEQLPPKCSSLARSLEMSALVYLVGSQMLRMTYVRTIDWGD